MQKTSHQALTLLVLPLVLLGANGCATHYDRGVEAAEDRDFATAVSEFTAEIDERGPFRSPTSSSSVLQRHQTGDRQLAAAYYGRALALLALGQNGDALRDFETATQIDGSCLSHEPEFAAAFQARAVERVGHGFTEDAMKDRRTAVRGDPQLTGRTQVEDATYAAAAAEFERGDFVAAERDFALLGTFRDAAVRTAEATRRREAKEAEERQRAEARLEAERREAQRVVGLVQNKRLLINRSGEENAFALIDFGDGGRISVLVSGANLSRWQVISQSQRVEPGQFVFAVNGVMAANSSNVIEIAGFVDVSSSRFNGNVTIYRQGGWPEEIRAGGRLVPLEGEGRR